ncbi:MAG: nucleoid-associated protein YgaU [Phycisphaerales bacterium]|jgi:nucleoid-associated protein YgaU
MRHESSQRVLFSMTLLAMLWIIVYWSWGPRDATPTVSFDDPPRLSEPTADPVPGGVARPAAQNSSAVGPIDPTLGTGNGVRVEPPEFRSYVIVAGETLEDLAQREYGDRRLWRAIAQANPLKDVERIRAGDTLRIPVDPANVQGVVVDASGERASPPPPLAPEFVEYVVKSGDTLSEISQAYYGTIRNADLIYQANRDSLRSMDDLKLGQTIRLPAAPAPGG